MHRAPGSLATHETMPFSSFSDPVDVARAQAALDAAWEQVRITVAEKDREQQRARLACIIASFALVAVDEADLISRALNHFRKSKP